MASSEQTAPTAAQQPEQSSHWIRTLKTIPAAVAVVAIGWVIYHLSTLTPLPWIVAVLAGVFGALFVGVVLLPTDSWAWLGKTFSRIPVIVLGSWLGMALTMGSMTVYIAGMHDYMNGMNEAIAHMRQDIGVMRGDMTVMAGNMVAMSDAVQGMSTSVIAMSDDVQQIDDAIGDVNYTLSYDIGPSVRVMAPAVTDMGHSMHRGVQSFSNPMEYMRNAIMPFP